MSIVCNNTILKKYLKDLFNKAANYLENLTEIYKIVASRISDCVC